VSQNVLQYSVTPARAEEIHRRVGQMSERGQIHHAERGMRIAKARPLAFLQALEGVAENLDAMAEAQGGETRRSNSTAGGYRVEPTIVQAWKEAYRTVDAGTPAISYAYYYAAAAEFAGI
jgi:hypothetical protein